MTNVLVVTTDKVDKRMVLLSLPGGVDPESLPLPGGWVLGTKPGTHYLQRGFDQLNVSKGKEALPDLADYIK